VQRILDAAEHPGRDRPAFVAVERGAEAGRRDVEQHQGSSQLRRVFSLVGQGTRRGVRRQGQLVVVQFVGARIEFASSQQFGDVAEPGLDAGAQVGADSLLVPDLDPPRGVGHRPLNPPWSG
jgi:hypothetical protein